MAAKWIETLTGSLEQKKRYRQYRDRIDALPEPYRSTAKAYHRYFMYYGGFADGETLVLMLTEFADLWERAATDGTSVREIVGEDPVEFGEAFVRAFVAREWIDKERERLVAAIERAERDGAGS